MIYDEVVRETLIEPLPAQHADEPAVEDLDPLPAMVGHDAMSCAVCKAWLAHVREPEGS